jgi:hypothetical protein
VIESFYPVLLRSGTITAVLRVAIREQNLTPSAKPAGCVSAGMDAEANSQISAPTAPAARRREYQPAGIQLTRIESDLRCTITVL